LQRIENLIEIPFPNLYILINKRILIDENLPFILSTSMSQIENKNPNTHLEEKQLD
jgi:hypothetical protein